MTYTRWLRAVLVFLGLCFQSFLTAGPIVQCKNIQGDDLYTNEIRYCVGDAVEQKLSANNVISSHHIAIDTNYRIHRREYLKYKNNSGWTIYYEAAMADEAAFLSRQSLARLVSSLKQVESILPSAAIEKLQTVDFYLMWGKASPQGGKAFGARYIRENERDQRDNIDPDWDNSVVIFSASNFLALPALQARFILVHEFAHAWHILEKTQDNSSIKAAANHAEQRKLYHLLKAKNGRYIAKAYAMKNYWEYFAELSAIYFVGGGYYPFQRSELKIHDPQGYKLMTQLWPDQMP